LGGRDGEVLMASNSSSCLHVLKGGVPEPRGGILTN
jgi:hypothetical protein